MCVYVCVYMFCMGVGGYEPMLALQQSLITESGQVDYHFCVGGSESGSYPFSPILPIGEISVPGTVP